MNTFKSPFESAVASQVITQVHLDEIGRLRAEVERLATLMELYKTANEAKGKELVRLSITPIPERVSCNRHVLAPHGFDRNGSHNADRYVCLCENWTPGEAS